MKYRSLIDYAEIYNCDKNGYDLGLDAQIFIRREATQRVFERPRIGTRGVSDGAAGASTDISAGSNTNLKAQVNGGAIVDVTLTLVGLTTGDAIAAELTTAINNALIAGAQDARVDAVFDGGDTSYEVYSQSTGEASSVVITAGDTDDVSADLGLGVANGGTESAGTDDQDALLYTTGGPTFEQPVESNPHRSGRFHSGIIRRKKNASFDITCLLNMQGDAGDSIDNALRVLYENVFGNENVIASTAIIYTQSIPCFTFSMVRVSTIMGEYYRGGYARDWTLTIPGDAEVTQNFTGRAADNAVSGLAKIDGAVVAGTDLVLENSGSKRYTVDGRVMVVAADGRTITAGVDGTLLVSSTDDGTSTVTLNSAVDAENGGYLVPWNPGAVQTTVRDNIYTDLVGRFKLSQSGPDIDTTNIELSLTNDHVDFDNRFGRDGNVGFAAANRATWNLSVSMDLSNENYGEVVRTREFGGFDPLIEVGDSAVGRYLKIAMPRWIPSVPQIDVPENGVTPVTIEGNLFPTQPGTRDPISYEFR